MTREHLARLWVVVTLGALFIASACYSGLDKLAPFPCAEDGTCPAPLECSVTTKQCEPPLSCSDNDAGFSQRECAGVCTATSIDPNNCGSCGIVCGDAGAASSCCGGGCTNMETDPKNCGSCGNACLTGQTCTNGTCSCPCGYTACGTTCVDTHGDPSNCGGCGVACTAAQLCDQGACTCPSPYTPCPSACSDLSSDTNNCGSCNNACSSGESCTNGTCTSGAACLTSATGYSAQSTLPSLSVGQGACSSDQVQAFVTACGYNGTAATCSAWRAANQSGFETGCGGSPCGACIFGQGGAASYAALYVPESGGYAYNYPACVWAEAQANGASSGEGEACGVAIENVDNCTDLACATCSDTAYSDCFNAAITSACEQEESAYTAACSSSATSEAYSECTPSGTSSDSDPDLTFIANLFCGGSPSGGSSSGSTSSSGGSSSSSGGTPTCVTPPSGIVSWWRAEQDITDSVGSNTGTAEGAVTYVPGEVGYAFHFNGTDYVEAPTTGLPTAASPRTVEAWVESDVTYASPGLGVASTYGSFSLNQSNEAFELGVGSESADAGGLSGIFPEFSSSGLLQSSTTTSIAAGTWIHIAATYDGANLTFYVNGVAVMESALLLSTSTSSEMEIGGTSLPSGLVPTMLTGAVDELTVYSRALTANEIAGIYAAGSAGKCAPVTK